MVNPLLKRKSRHYRACSTAHAPPQGDQSMLQRRTSSPILSPLESCRGYHFSVKVLQNPFLGQSSLGTSTRKAAQAAVGALRSGKQTTSTDCNALTWHQ